jgi:glycosyltransferase involved in cell wall biosynthesis
MENELVSILIPVYNRVDIVGETINSAINQSYKNLEIIIVDNCSTDGTFELLKQYAAKDERIYIFQNEENIGPVRNWKRCIDEAKGKYAKILFSDDVIESDFLEQTLPFLVDSDVGFVYSSVKMGADVLEFQIRYRNFTHSGTYSSVCFIEKSLFGSDMPISPGCAIFRLKDLKENLVTNIPSPSINDFLDHGAGPDLLIYLLTARKYSSIAFIDKSLTFFRAHNDSISLSDKSKHLTECYIQSKVWFVESYFNKSEINRYYSHLWYQLWRANNKWISPQTILKQYTPLFKELSFRSMFELGRFIVKSKYFDLINRLIDLKNKV